MRRVRYSVAASLDGFIAGPNGEYDWIPMDPAIDFAAFFSTVDTVLLGRKTWEVVADQEPSEPVASMATYVFSTTLDPGAHPGVTVVAENAADVVRRLKDGGGERDIWLMGGGELCASLLGDGLVDTFEIGIVPKVLGRGIPLLPPGASASLSLRKTETFPSGIVLAKYDVT